MSLLHFVFLVRSSFGVHSNVLYSFKVAEVQFLEAKGCLGLVQKEMSHAHDVAAAQLAEAQACR